MDNVLEHRNVVALLQLGGKENKYMFVCFCCHNSNLHGALWKLL